MPGRFQQSPLSMTRCTAFLIFRHERNRKSSVGESLRTVANVICELDVAKSTGPDCIPSVVLKMCSPEFSSGTNPCLSHVSHLVGNVPLLYLLTKMMEKDLILVTIVTSITADDLLDIKEWMFK